MILVRDNVGYQKKERNNLLFEAEKLEKLAVNQKEMASKLEDRAVRVKQLEDALVEKTSKSFIDIGSVTHLDRVLEPIIRPSKKINIISISPESSSLEILYSSISTSSP